MTYVLGENVEIDYALVADPDFSHPGVVIFDNKVMRQLASRKIDLFLLPW